MSVSRAFDLALFVGTPANVNDGALVSALGPPFTAAFKPVVTASQPGVTVGASTPAATAQNQIMVSGVGPGFAWGLTTNPAAAAQVPPPGGLNHVLLSDSTPAWQDSTLNNMLLVGGACLFSSGGTFATGANLTFTASATPRTRLDGGDPTLSTLDNFGIDAGTF
jgi:hypothetical protein